MLYRLIVAFQWKTISRTEFVAIYIVSSSKCSQISAYRHTYTACTQGLVLLGCHMLNTSWILANKLLTNTYGRKRRVKAYASSVFIFSYSVTWGLSYTWPLRWQRKVWGSWGSQSPCKMNSSAVVFHITHTQSNGIS